jgi:hypothetical protein
MKRLLVLVLYTLLGTALTAPVVARDGGSGGSGSDGGGLRDARGGRGRDDGGRRGDGGRRDDDGRRDVRGGRDDGGRELGLRRRHGDGLRRQPIVVHREFPLRRLRRNVIVISPRISIRVSPLIFLPPVVWSSTIISSPPPAEALVWEDGEDLFFEDDWTEFSLVSNARGRALYLEIVAGRVKFDWAEVVFDSGETQVVDFSEATRGRGLYLLHDFRDGRTVDHVRLVARAMTPEARVLLRMDR